MQLIVRKDGIETELLSVSDLDMKIVEHYVLCFQEWLDEDHGPRMLINNKIKARKERLLPLAEATLTANNQSIPETELDLLEAYFALPDYKNRKQRDEAEAILKTQELAEARIKAEAEAQAQQQAFQNAVNAAVAQALEAK